MDAKVTVGAVVLCGFLVVLLIIAYDACRVIHQSGGTAVVDTELPFSAGAQF